MPQRMKPWLDALGDKQTGLLLVLLAAFLFSSKSIFIKLAYRYGGDADTLLVLRMLFSLPIYIAILWRAGPQHHQQPVKTLLACMACGFFGFYAASYLDLMGLQYIGAGLERLILYSYPSIVLILSALVYRKPISPGMLLCVVLSYIGIFIVYGADAQTAVIGDPEQYRYGALLVLASAFCFAIYLTSSEYVLRFTQPSWFTAWAMIGASIIIGLHALVANNIDSLFGLHGGVYFYAIIVALFCTALPSILISAGIQRIGASAAGVAGSAGPMLTFLLAAILLDEVLSWRHLLGMAVVVAAITLLSRLQSRAQIQTD